ncbi:glycosyltransferase family 1 protein [Agromyces sp. G08B096]|uniref:Glycosyltransferase family 1 protein n=1 Tax=Agromyces sp. G08B096 TaxID=3156399 RepID=A0AAU7W4C7_9MICO
MRPLHGSDARVPVDVGVSLMTMVAGGMGGSETYARALVAGLARRDDVALRAATPENVAVEGAVSVRGIVARPSTIGRLRAIASSVLLGRRVRAALADAAVIHYPFTVAAPRARRNQATVITVHDVQHKELPRLFSPLERLFRVFAYDRPARRADLVITISEFAKAGIVRHLGVDTARVQVVPLGVDTSSYQPNLGERAAFVLYPARGWPHKNHVRLVEAIELLRRDRPGLRLVLTGGDLERLGDFPDWVDVRGLVSGEELRRLYQDASVLAFPSLYEGFGLPPLEAMASGCPVAASNAGSIPEVCGTAAVYFDPHDPVDIARGIGDAIDQTKELQRAGLAHVASLTWDRCVDGHVEAYRKVVSGRALGS